MRPSPLRLLPLALLIAGCRGKLVATAELAGPGTAETTFVNDGKKLTLWADTDGKWTGSKRSALEVAYEIDLTGPQGKQAHVSCSTTEHGGKSFCGTSVTIGGSHEANCEIALGCTLPPLPSGEVKARVVGTKGPNAVLIRKMSLNIREE